MQSPRALHFTADGVCLEGWLGGLRTRADGGLARLELVPGALRKKEGWQWHRLLRAHVLHVIAAACDIAMTTVLVGEDCAAIFAPLPQVEADRQLRGWLAAWHTGMQQPLPVALKTAVTWLQTASDDKARTAYEGGVNQTGEVARSASLARQYPDYDALTASGDFADWSECLYRPLLDHEPECSEESPA